MVAAHQGNDDPGKSVVFEAFLVTGGRGRSSHHEGLQQKGKKRGTLEEEGRRNRSSEASGNCCHSSS